MTQKGRFLVAVLLVLLMAGQAFAYELLSGPTGTVFWDKKQAYNGYTLYYPESGTNTYLVDMKGNLVNIWPGVGNPMLTEDGYLFGIYGDRHDYGDLVMMDWKGKIVKRWSAPANATLSANAKVDGIICSDGVKRNTVFHHDFNIVTKADGSRSVFAIARVLRSPAEVAAAGFTAGPGGGFGAVDGWCDTDAILEFDMDGNLIWQWEMWDRMIQNQKADGTKYSADISNYGKFYVTNGTAISGDFTHANSVNYNPVRDEVLINPVKSSSFYVVDHSISSEEAQGPAGDFVYRWGDPSEYDSRFYPAGIKTSVSGKTGAVTQTYGKNDSQIGGSHNVHWIPEGLPGAGNFLVFSNSGSPYIDGGSAVVEINPYTTNAETFAGPEDYWKTASYVRQEVAGTTAVGATKKPGSGTVLSNQLVMYFATSLAYGQYEKAGYFSGHISGVQRLPNGNTLVCSGEPGQFFELTPTVSSDWTTKLLCRKSESVWNFVNPYCMPRDNDTRAWNADHGQDPTKVFPSYASYLWSTLKKDPEADIIGQLYQFRPAGVDGQVFRALRYGSKFQGFKGKKLKPQGPLNNPKKWKKSFRGFGFGGKITGGGGGGTGGATGGGNTGY